MWEIWKWSQVTRRSDEMFDASPRDCLDQIEHCGQKN